MARLDYDLGLPSMDPQSWISTGKRLAGQAIWADEPRDQMKANAVIVVGLMVSTVGFTVGLPVALASLALFNVGLARFVVQKLRGWRA